MLELILIFILNIGFNNDSGNPDSIINKPIPPVTDSIVITDDDNP